MLTINNVVPQKISGEKDHRDISKSKQTFKMEQLRDKQGKKLLKSGNLKLNPAEMIHNIKSTKNINKRKY